MVHLGSVAHLEAEPTKVLHIPKKYRYELQERASVSLLKDVARTTLASDKLWRWKVAC